MIRTPGLVGCCCCCGMAANDEVKELEAEVLDAGGYMSLRTFIRITPNRFFPLPFRPVPHSCEATLLTLFLPTVAFSASTHVGQLFFFSPGKPALSFHIFYANKLSAQKCIRAATTMANHYSMKPWHITMSQCNNWRKNTAIHQDHVFIYLSMCNALLHNHYIREQSLSSNFFPMFEGV